MINLRDKNFGLPTGIFATAAVVLAGTLIYIMLVPVPTTQGLAKAEKSKEQPLLKTITITKQYQKEKEKLIAAMTFSGQEQDAESATLAQVTKLTIDRHIKLVGFRPQRGIDAGALTQLPFLVSVSGRFSDVLAFTHDLETTGSKLAVNIVQVAASDPSSDDVSANINIVGYLNQPLGNGGQNG